MFIQIMNKTKIYKLLFYKLNIKHTGDKYIKSEFNNCI